MLTFWEISCLVKQNYDKATDSVCKRHGIKHREFDILMYLNDYPDQATATDIVKKENLSKSHVSVSLRALEEKGLIRGEYRGSNRRTIYLSLNESASKIINDGIEARMNFAKNMLNGFSEAEATEFRDYLIRLNKNIISQSKK